MCSFSLLANVVTESEGPIALVGLVQAALPLPDATETTVVANFMSGIYMFSNKCKDNNE